MAMATCSRARLATGLDRIDAKPTVGVCTQGVWSLSISTTVPVSCASRTSTLVNFEDAEAIIGAQASPDARLCLILCVTSNAQQIDTVHQA